ncbi:uncharacterized protein VP01_5133g2 [Puccinia sorghi]|uniref:Uncharacterized protein n=1 Tax=Puccinia sorghi TaxID=27349 RepID=A0A0L6UL34_9BASI|nr:uncharacterized protein VP01_5133g2 [Puccinia sorghi]
MAALGVDLFSRNSGDPNHTKTNQSHEQDPIEEFEFNKSENFLISDSESYNQWVQSAACLAKDVVSCGLKLSNENSSQIKKQEAAAAEVWNHLISIEAGRNASTSRRRNQDDLNDPTLDFEDKTNLYMEKLYQAHQPNLKYEKDFPIFIDTTDPNRYIPLTLATVQAWAKALNSGTDGVSISSPPSSLRFVNLSSKKCKINHETSGSNNVGQLLVNLLISKNKVGCPSPSDGSQSSDSEVGTTAIINYLKFIKIRPTKHEEVLEILEKNDITSFKLFKSKNITQDHMSRWVLSNGIIAQFRDNVLKYKKSLHHPKV